MKNSRTVEIDYTNWRGERSKRLILPIHMWFGVTEWHQEPQWLLHATDIAKWSPRDFSMANIHSWREVGATGDKEVDKEAETQKELGE